MCVVNEHTNDFPKSPLANGQDECTLLSNSPLVFCGHIDTTTWPDSAYILLMSFYSHLNSTPHSYIYPNCTVYSYVYPNCTVHSHVRISQLHCSQLRMYIPTALFTVMYVYPNCTVHSYVYPSCTVHSYVYPSCTVHSYVYPSCTVYSYV